MKTNTAAANARFHEVYAEAVTAGKAAGEAVRPTPMTVRGQFGSEPAKYWYEPEGACGFAWVTVRPGTSSFARWLVKNHYARAAYGGGVQIWISDHNQSVDRKTAHADAMAKVLRDKLGIATIYADSRLD